MGLWRDLETEIVWKGETQTLKRLLHSREKSLAVIKIRIVFFMTENPFHEFYTIRQQGEFIKSVLSQHSSYNWKVFEFQADGTSEIWSC